MLKTARFAALLLLASAVALPACKSKDSGKKQRKVTMKMGGTSAPNAVTANVADFDPNADFVLELDKYGSERPDEYAVQQAFFGQFEALDECVAKHKQRKGSDNQLLGDVAMAVKLNPEKRRPFAVNAQMPEDYAKAKKLADCLREAAASAPYPTYDGPPVIVEFEFELDPGYYEE